MPKKTKSTKVIFHERVETVMEMLLSGLRRREIIQNVSENPKLQWNVDERQIDNYIQEARKQIEEVWESDAESLKKKFTARYEFLWRRMIAVKDYKNAKDLIEKQLDLYGLKPASKIEGNLEVNVKQITGMQIK